MRTQKWTLGRRGLSQHMTDTYELSTEDVARSRQVKWLIGLRLLVAFLFLGSAGILALREHPPLH